MQPTSLVFVAIIAGWIAYLLPRWVARRDALGLSRAEDRDSEQLRVLPRRDRTPITSGRASAHSTRSSGPLSARPVRTAHAAPSSSASVITTRNGPGLLHTPADPRARRLAASRRAGVLITLLVFTLTSWAVVALPSVPWWAALPATALLIADVTALVLSARARASHRRAAARRSATLIMQSAVRAGERGSDRPAGRDARPSVHTGAAMTGARDAGPSRARGMDAVLDLDRLSGETAPSASERTESADTWTPVPVPVPTYLLKPVVPRPEPVVEDDVAPPAADSAETKDSVPAEPKLALAPAPERTRPWETEHTWADDIDLFLARRRAVNG